MHGHTTHLVNQMAVFSSCKIQWFQALIHTTFHSFKKSVRFFMNNYIVNEKKLSKLKSGQYLV